MDSESPTESDAPAPTQSKAFAYFENEEPPSIATSESKTSAKTSYAIVTSVWDANYASFALMLGWSIKQHNSIGALDIELVLLTLKDVEGTGAGITAENRTRLEKVGWTIREEEPLQVPGVNMSMIQKHRRKNLNKLQIFGWDEYEKIVFMDADTLCKGPLEELFHMPGGKCPPPILLAITKRLSKMVSRLRSCARLLAQGGDRYPFQ
jgi:alpha-N-acetylglucosamine transferase